MEYTSIGKNDLKISKFALGTWPFAGGELWGNQDDKDSISAVHECYENGINFFDTAPGYGDGRSEEVLGKAIGFPFSCKRPCSISNSHSLEGISSINS